MDPICELAISPEQKTALWSIRADWNQYTHLQSLLDEKLDWSSITHFAARNGILPLVYSRLKTFDDSHIPGEVLERLKRYYLTNTQRNLRLTRMLVRISDLLSKEHIQHIPFKGPLLAIQLYGDTSLRQFTDLDILIREGDFSRCVDILTNAGFEPHIQLGETEKEWLLRGDTDIKFSYQGDHVEVHWAIAERGILYPLKMEHLWLNLGQQELHGRSFPTLSPRNLLLALCLHGTKHSWTRLSWITDLVYFLDTYPGLDWPRTIEYAQEKGLGRAVCLGLRLAEQLCGARLPLPLAAEIDSDRMVDQLADQTIKTILTKPSMNEKTSLMYYLQSRERTRDRFYYIFDQVFIPKQVDWTSIKLSRRLYPAYYILRPIRLLQKFSSQ